MPVCWSQLKFKSLSNRQQMSNPYLIKTIFVQTMCVLSECTLIYLQQLLLSRFPHLMFTMEGSCVQECNLGNSFETLPFVSWKKSPLIVLSLHNEVRLILIQLKLNKYFFPINQKKNDKRFLCFYLNLTEFAWWEHKIVLNIKTEQF